MKTETIILDYLEEENLFPKQISNNTLEFGYAFSFPPGLRKAPLQVIQPKQKDFIVISLGIQIPEGYIQALNTLDPEKKGKFFFEIRKFLLLKNFLFNFDLQHYRFQISDQIFLKREKGISKNSFFKIVRKIYNTGQYCNMILAEFCAGKLDTKDLHDDLTPTFYS